MKMNPIYLFAGFLLLVSSAHAAPSPAKDGAATVTVRGVLNEALRSITECNANICFSLDGSGSITSEEFGLSKNFVQEVSNQIVIVPGTEYFSANQFGRVAYPISLLTDDLDQFSRLIENTPFIRDGSTSVGAGIVQCDAMLALAKTDGPRKMVVITDGRNSFGGDPVRNAEIFRNRLPINKVTTVGIGRYADPNILQDIAGPDGTVLAIDQYIDLFLIVNDLVTDICQ